jgi:hypothetical protein
MGCHINQGLKIYMGWIHAHGILLQNNIIQGYLKNHKT